MRHFVAPAFVLLLTLALPLAAHATHAGHESASQAVDVSGGLGHVHFENSGALLAQPDFQRGLALLHSFEYSAARAAFERAEQLDPGFAMAYWGEALTYNHTLWAEQDLPAARAALAQLGGTPGERAAKAKTPREQAYLAAVEQLYGEGDKPQRDARYCALLADLARTYPDDLDARALYALALLGLSGGIRNEANYMRAAAEAEAVFMVDPQHPGALHYLIHAYDDPVHAPLGLRAARLYAAVAPAAAHAEHMPSHIYFALGMWDEAIAANRASLETSRAHGDGGYHALLWLEYAYLQKGDREPAAELLRSVAHDVIAAPTPDNRLRLAFARAIWLAETGSAAGAEVDLPVEAVGAVDAGASPIPAMGYFATLDFVRGIAAARGHDLAGARAQLESLHRRCAAEPRAGGVKAAWFETLTPEALTQCRALALALGGIVEFDEGRHAEGLAAIREAVAVTARMEFEYGPPWSAKPLAELLGERLQEDGNAAGARAAFQATLADYPNRRATLAALATLPPLSTVAESAAPAVRPRRQDLLGTWRLLRIERVAEVRTGPDPFYHEGVTGTLIYDPSGWMSVQIAGARRPHVPLPAVRAPFGAAASGSGDKAAAFDSFYAYSGTWFYDEDASTVTHRISESLYPSENGVAYTQTGLVEGDRLIFSSVEKTAAGDVLHRKVWQRVTGP